MLDAYDERRGAFMDTAENNLALQCVGSSLEARSDRADQQLCRQEQGPASFPKILIAFQVAFLFVGQITCTDTVHFQAMMKF